MLQQQDERQREREGTGMTPITDWRPACNYVGKYVSSRLEISPYLLVLDSKKYDLQIFVGQYQAVKWQ